MDSAVWGDERGEMDVAAARASAETAAAAQSRGTRILVWRGGSLGGASCWAEAVEEYELTVDLLKLVGAGTYCSHGLQAIALPPVTRKI